MQVIQYLKEFGIQSLRDEFGIKVRETDDLLVLNYDQIESPKTHPIVIECRALILDREFNIVSRSFDRFFNLGEAPLTQTHLDWSIAGAHEKVDGSLMKVYNHRGYWYIATRGMAYAEGATEFGVTFKQLALKAFGLGSDAEMQVVFNKYLQSDRTYIFELTSMENRVVKHYEGYMMHYLAARVNATGEYGGSAEEVQAQLIGGKYIEKLKFASAQDCLEASRALKNLDEGYVIYQNGIPVCKVKSPAYLAVHAIRGEGLNPKRIMQLVLVNEQDEYLSYYPEDETYFLPYVAAMEELVSEIKFHAKLTKDIEDQRQFAKAIKGLPFSAALFKARQSGESAIREFHNQRESYKMKTLEAYL